jgi:ribonuclease R
VTPREARSRKGAAGSLRSGATPDGGPRGGAAPVVAVLERQGRFLTAEPFFARGRRITVERPKPGNRSARTGRPAGPGDLVLIAPTGQRAGHGRILARLGRPDVARDVLEALMLDRGLRRRFDPLVEREARAAAEHVARDVARRDLRDLPTFTIDPPTARDFDDAISAERLDGGAVRVWVTSPTSPRTSRRARRSTGRPPARDQRLRAGQGRADAARGALQRRLLARPHQDRLAVTVELDLDWRRRPSAAPSHRSVIAPTHGLVSRAWTGFRRPSEPRCPGSAPLRRRAPPAARTRRRTGRARGAPAPGRARVRLLHEGM